MFERFTEPARRLIFFAKYEASNMQSPFVGTEHLLLGFLRQEKAMAQRFFHSETSLDSTREKIEARQTASDINPATLDAPLSMESKRALANATMEADRRAQPIAPVHILLGLLHEEKSFAAELLCEYGLSLASVTSDLEKANLLPTRNAGRSPSIFTLKTVNPKLARGSQSVSGSYREGPPTDSGLRRHVICENMTMAEFAESLPGIAPGYIRRGKVVDATGLGGRWNFTMNFSVAMAKSQRGRVTLFEALEDQLGLRLERSPGNEAPPQPSAF